MWELISMRKQNVMKGEQVVVNLPRCQVRVIYPNSELSEQEIEEMVMSCHGAILTLQKSLPLLIEPLARDVQSPLPGPGMALVLNARFMTELSELMSIVAQLKILTSMSQCSPRCSRMVGEELWYCKQMASKLFSRMTDPTHSW